jgi:hypothetical protein
MAAGQAYKGKNLRIKVDDETIFHSTECSFNSSMSLEEIATKDTDGNLVVSGNYTWGVATNMLVADKAVGSSQEDFVSLLNKHKAGTQVEIAFTTGTTGDIIITGNAYIESINFTAPTSGFATGDASFKGSGDYTVGTVPV